MKKLFLAIILTTIVLSSRAAIMYDIIEFKPVGKHYSVKWNKLYYAPYKNVTGDRLTLLYFKVDNGLLIFKGFWISKSLEAKLPVAVQKYIGKHITDIKLKETKSVQAALSATQEAVNKALDTKWLNALRSNSVNFSGRNLYNRDYAGYDMNYYEFFPLEKNDLLNPSDLHDTTVLKLFAESLLSKNRVILERDRVLSEVKDNLLKKPDFDRTISSQKYRYDNLMDVVEKIRKVPYHHGKLKISDWPLASAKRWGLSTSAPNGFHTDSDSTCKYLMMLQVILKKEQFMPTMAWKQNYGNWKATRCNMFAGDFSQQVLGLTTYPWGTKNWNANTIHENLPIIEDFVAISWDKAWEYVNLGYPVFITTPKPPDGDAGHIAIAYPIDSGEETGITSKPETALAIGMVVQAGSDNGLMLVGSAFKTGDFVKQGTVYIYLGYLKSNN